MNIGGIYTDPFHSPVTARANIFGFQGPWYGGLRILSRVMNNSNQFVALGCDDGLYFWTLTGTIDDTSNATEMDFTPKAPGVGLLSGQLRRGALDFLEPDQSVGNTWWRLTAAAESGKLLQPAKQSVAFNEMNGLYVDRALYHEGSFAGIRVVSDRRGNFITDDQITVVGTNNGVDWWCHTGGKFKNRQQGTFQVGPLQCSSSRQGLGIELQDGTQWTRMVTAGDFHVLPQGAAMRN